MKEPVAFGPDLDAPGSALESWKETAAVLGRVAPPTVTETPQRVTPRMLWGLLAGLLLATAAIWLWPA